MRPRYLILLTIVCAIWANDGRLIANAFWQSRDSNYNISIAGPAGFQGPGDITSGGIFFVSPGRAYNAAYAAGQNPLADLVDTATGLLTCTEKVGTNGFADLTTAYCPTASPTTNVVTWCTVTVGGCSITKLYDQTGTGNHVVQATLANMPALTFNAQNGLPCAAGGSNSPRLVTAGNIVQVLPFTMGGVAMRGSGFTTVQTIQSNANANFLRFAASANQVTAASSTPVNLTAADSSFHALLAVVSATAPLFAVDSSANTSTSTSGTTTTSSTEGIVGRNTGANPLLAGGFVCEDWIYPADLNSSYQAMLANMRSATNGWNF